jgi:hypothetical protein
MSHRLRNLILCLSLATSTTVGCTLIAEVDRSKIPDEGEGGEGNTGDGDTSATTSGDGDGDGGQGGEGGAQ